MSSIPISSTSLARICRHETLYWACVSTVEQRNGWIAFHNQKFNSRIDPNHAGEFRATAGQSTTIVEEVIKFYQTAGVVPAAYVDLLTTPDDLIVNLLQANFQEWDGALSDLMVYLGPDQMPATAVHVEVAESVVARKAWASVVADEDKDDLQAYAQLQEYYLTQVSNPHMTAYLVRVDRKPACRCQLFSGEGLGRIEAVRTSTSYHGRGLATAVVRRALSDSLQRNQITYIYAEPGSNAQHLYYRLGFRTVAQNAIRGFLWQG